MRDTSAVRLPVFDFDVDGRAAGALLRLPALRVAAATDLRLGGVPSPTPLVVLRRADLVADLRRARAERFADRYEWLSLRRRRAQIAARHAVGEGR
jgi:hypothetical protein